MNVHRTKQANLLKYLEHWVQLGVREGVLIQGQLYSLTVKVKYADREAATSTTRGQRGLIQWLQQQRELCVIGS